MLGRTPNDVISEPKKLFVLLSKKLFTAGDIFGSFIRRPNSRSLLVAISDSTEFRHDMLEVEAQVQTWERKKYF